MEQPVMRWVRPNTRGARPSPRYFHAMANIGDAVIVVGGKDDHTRFTDVHVLNKEPASYQWAQPHLKGMPPKPRSAHSLSVVENKVFVFGGHRDGEKFNDMHVLDTKTMSWFVPKVKGKPPGKRNAHATAVFGRSLFVFGGFDGESCNDFHKFDTMTNTWTQPVTSAPPCRRCCHTLTTIANNIWVFAGKNNDSAGVIERFNDIHSIDPSTGKWVDHLSNITGIPPSKRNAHTACDYRNYLIVFGGFDGESCNDLFMFNTLTLTWQELMTLTPPPASRYCHSSISFPSMDGLSDWSVMLFGGCDSDHNYSDVQVLEIGLGRLRQGGEEAEQRVRTLEMEKNRLNKVIQKQNEMLIKLRSEKMQLEAVAGKDERQMGLRLLENNELNEGFAKGDSDESEGEEPEKKKKKRKKTKKERRKSRTEAEQDNQDVPFKDEEGKSSSAQRQLPRPPAHLAPLELARVPNRPEIDTLPSTCPNRSGSLNPPALFPPLRV